MKPPRGRRPPHRAVGIHEVGQRGRVLISPVNVNAYSVPSSIGVRPAPRFGLFGRGRRRTPGASQDRLRGVRADELAAPVAKRFHQFDGHAACSDNSTPTRSAQLFAPHQDVRGARRHEPASLVQRDELRQTAVVTGILTRSSARLRSRRSGIVHEHRHEPRISDV